MARILERLSGVGVLEDDSGGRHPVSYQLIVTEDEIEIGNGMTMPGLRDIGGVVEPKNPILLLDLMTGDSPVVLHLEDGRKAPLLIVSSEGAVAGAGGGIAEQDQAD